MKASLFYRLREFRDRHTNKIWLFLLVCGIGGALLGIRNEGVERREQICDALVNGQRVDRLLIDTVLDEPAGGGIPLLDVESYAGLPPAVQTYVRDLAAEAAPDPDDPPSLAERLEAFRDANLGPDDLPDYCNTG